MDFSDVVELWVVGVKLDGEDVNTAPRLFTSKGSVRYHPSVIAFDGGGVDDGFLFIVVRYLVGVGGAAEGRVGVFGGVLKPGLYSTKPGVGGPSPSAP